MYIMILKLYNMIWGIGKQFSQKTLSVHSAHVVFFVMVSFFPFIMFFFTLLQHTPIEENSLLYIIETILPTNISSILANWIEEAYEKSSGTLLSVTVISMVWAGSKGFMGITYGLDKIYDGTIKRNWFYSRIHSFFYTILFAIILIISLIVLVYGNKIFLALDSFFGIEAPWFIGFVSLRSILGFGIFFLYFLLLYTYVPNRKGSLKEEIPGALFTAIMWIVCSYIFSIYIDNFSNFTSVYGSLTYIVLFMLWMYLCVNILFIGALLNRYLSFDTDAPSK